MSSTPPIDPKTTPLLIFLIPQKITEKQPEIDFEYDLDLLN